ncbi:MAG TPA: hypothetical protein VHW43_13515 [Puia sp.]|nr:hypothetical protein [Puia sp.]
MQKIKWSLMTTAVVLGIVGAIFTRPHTTASKIARPFYAANGCLAPEPDMSVPPPAVR